MDENKLKKEKKKNLFQTFIIIILLFVIFLLLMQKNEEICKGNSEIFEVGCDKNDPECLDNIESSLTISDDKKTWTEENQIDIFSNPLYDDESLIAPLSTNSYRFIISNNSNIDIEYKFEFNEINKYDINMMYRLKRGEEYLVGNEEEWVKYEKLNIEKLNIKSKNKQVFYLEWKWFESDNDTNAGIAAGDYTLSMTISSQQKVAA